MNAIALSLHDITKVFGHTRAVDGLSVNVNRGTVFGLLGPNGSGKTTTIRMIMNILLPDTGRVELLGESPSAVVRECVGYLPEERGLYPKMRVLDEIVFFGEMHGLSRRDARRNASRVLDEIGEKDWANRVVSELSKGQQQSVQFACAVVHNPEFIILDEPFTGLDPVNTEAMLQSIRDLAAQGKTVVLSTHRMEQVEQVCDTICLIDHGRAIVSGTLDEVRSRSDGKSLVIATDVPVESLSTIRGVVSCEKQADGYRLHIDDSTTPEDVVRQVFESGSVTRFEVERPSLHEIFVKAVSQ
jgi:ABC-2 type transport system ATP-binding protein